jgi:hypothetical protein
MKYIKVGVALMLALAAAAVAAQDVVGVVKRSKGDVAIERGGLRIAATKGTELHRGDRLVTSKDAYAYVDMHGAAPLAIGPETMVSVDRFSGDDKHVARRSAPRLLQSLASYLALNRQR